MANIFFISDTHFFHENILKFTDSNTGERIRPMFRTIEEMHERIIENWNFVVKDGDHVYHGGDVTFRYGSEFNELMSRLKGRKRLILGNHDDGKNENLLKHFQKVMAWRVFKDEKFILTHMPITPITFRHKCTHNVHGHIHQNPSEGPFYINISVEAINYMPLHMDEILQKMKA